MRITRCPRCSEYGLENFKSFAQCPSCLFTEDFTYDPEEAEAIQKAITLTDGSRKKTKTKGPAIIHEVRLELSLAF